MFFWEWSEKWNPRGSRVCEKFFFQSEVKNEIRGRFTGFRGSVTEWSWKWNPRGVRGSVTNYFSAWSEKWNSNGVRESVTNYFFRVKRKMNPRRVRAFDGFWKILFMKSAGGRGVWSKIGTFSQFEKHDSSSKFWFCWWEFELAKMQAEEERDRAKFEQEQYQKQKEKHIVRTQDLENDLKRLNIRKF